MITLYGFGPGCGLPDLSPFVTKAETLLRMANLTYRVRRADVRKAPKGKLPYIEDDGLLVADTSFIRAHIEQKYAVDFDAGYTPQERAIGLAFQRVLEDHAYWAFVHARWMIDRNFEAGPKQYFAKLPALVRPVVTRLVRRNVARTLDAQGFGRHSRGEIEQLAIADIDAIAVTLADRPFLLGARASGIDASLFAFVLGGLCPAFETPLRSALEGHTNLVAYRDRMMQIYFPNGFSAPA